MARHTLPNHIPGAVLHSQLLLPALLLLLLCLPLPVPMLWLLLLPP
jgi:hypothetical protein